MAAPLAPHAFDSKPYNHAGDPLDEVLAATQSRAAQWRKDGAEALKLELQRGVEELRRECAGLDDLHAQLLSAERMTEAIKKSKAEEFRQRDAMKRSTELLTQQAKAAQSTVDKLREAQCARQKELGREEEGLLQECREAEAQEAEIERLLSLYPQRLGFSISRAAPRTVRMSFTLLHKEDPSREFLLTLGLDEQKGYCVFECNPRVPQVEPLLEQLNRRAGVPSALPTFVLGMRQAFQQAASITGKSRPRP
uniref:Kinetochore protein SPC25 n=1 Tax=Alexandrium andersonii TaxID=327968 RepID=A0A7S2IDU5_9DINO